VAIDCLDALMADQKPRESIISVPPLGVVERVSTNTFAIEDREVAHAVEFIRAHATEQINVTDIAGRVQIARGTLERRFRQVTGCTLHDYLIQQRLRRAQELLAQKPPPSLQSVARQCGFLDRRRLNQVFQRVTGHSPVVWIQNHAT
jgi:LacI family transcriptional regulator